MAATRSWYLGAPLLKLITMTYPNHKKSLALLSAVKIFRPFFTLRPLAIPFVYMVASWHGNAFHIASPFWGESTSDWHIPSHWANDIQGSTYIVNIMTANESTYVRNQGISSNAIDQLCLEYSGLSISFQFLFFCVTPADSLVFPFHDAQSFIMSTNSSQYLTMNCGQAAPHWLLLYGHTKIH